MEALPQTGEENNDVAELIGALLVLTRKK
ncbi:LPXTG cell wall anchor domain-containing protein [Listeria rocourtiae]